MANDNRKSMLGDKIRTLRTEQGLSQRKLALMVGTNQTHLWQIETGKTNVSIELLCRIADGLGVQVKELVDF